MARSDYLVEWVVTTLLGTGAGSSPRTRSLGPCRRSRSRTPAIRLTWVCPSNAQGVAGDKRGDGGISRRAPRREANPPEAEVLPPPPRGSWEHLNSPSSVRHCRFLRFSIRETTPPRGNERSCFVFKAHALCAWRSPPQGPGGLGPNRALHVMVYPSRFRRNDPAEALGGPQPLTPGIHPPPSRKGECIEILRRRSDPESPNRVFRWTCEAAPDRSRGRGAEAGAARCRLSGVGRTGNEPETSVVVAIPDRTRRCPHMKLGPLAGPR